MGEFESGVCSNKLNVQKIGVRINIESIYVVVNPEFFLPNSKIFSEYDI